MTCFLDSKDSSDQLIHYLSERSEIEKFMWSTDDILSHLESQRPWLALTVEHEILAFVLYSMTQENLEILYLETNPSKLRQGWMDQLMKELINRSEAREIWLDVHEDNGPAQELYKKWGFKTGGSRAKYYRDGASALLMKRMPQES